MAIDIFYENLLDDINSINCNQTCLWNYIVINTFHDKFGHNGFSIARVLKELGAQGKQPGLS